MPETPIWQPNTWIFDSIGADSVRTVPLFATPEVREHAHEQARADSVARARTFATVPDDHPGATPASTPHPDTVTVAGGILMATVAVAALNSGLTGRALRRYSRSLTDVRNRANAFDKVGTAPLHGAAMLMAVLFAAGGICLAAATGHPTTASILLCMAVAAGYYLFDLLAYNLTGYVFADADKQGAWSAGFNATQGWSAVALAPLAALLLACPAWAGTLVILAGTVYVTARLVFVIKGFRIFYTGFGSLFYFILYLCTLEIIPVLAVFRICRIISGNNG